MLDETPSGWEQTTFGECFDFKGGNQPPKDTFLYEPTEGYVRLLQIRDFESDDKPAYIPVSASKGRCSKEDILIARYGASLGRILRGKEGAYNVALVKLIFQKQIDRDFAFYWLNSDYFQEPLVRVGSRSAQAGFNKSDLAPFSILLPPLPEQERIAEVLTSVDDSIRATEAVIAQAERVKRGLMEDLLTGGLGSEAIARGEVPEGWKRVAISSVATVVTGKTPSTKEEGNWGGKTPFVTPSDLNNAVFISSAERTISDRALSTLKLLPKNSLLYTCIASIGKSAIAVVPCVTNQQINACIFKDSCNALFAYYHLKLRKSEIEALAGKTAVAIVNKSKFSAFEIVLPSKDKQVDIATIIGTVDDQIEANRQTVDQLQRLKRGLMDDLLTGRVRTVR